MNKRFILNPPDFVNKINEVKSNKRASLDDITTPSSDDLLDYNNQNPKYY